MANLGMMRLAGTPEGGSLEAPSPGDERVPDAVIRASSFFRALLGDSSLRASVGLAAADVLGLGWRMLDAQHRLAGAQRHLSAAAGRCGQHSFAAVAFRYDLRLVARPQDISLSCFAGSVDQPARHHGRGGEVPSEPFL